MNDLAHIKLTMSKEVCPKVNSFMVNGVEFGDKAESVVLVVNKGIPKAVITLHVDELDVDGYFDTTEPGAGEKESR